MPFQCSIRPSRLPARFWLIALALHVAVLAYPVSKVLRESAATGAPLDVRMTRAAVQAAAPPLPPPHPPPAKPHPTSPQLLHAAEKPNTPAIAATPIAPAPPSPVPTPAASTAPAAPVAAAPANPAPIIQAARFDAAYLKNPRPAYPPLSRRLNEEGQVVLRVQVSPEGLPSRVEVAQSSRFPRLDEAARQAVERWHFIPARRGNEAIEAQVLVPLIFRLED